MRGELLALVTEEAVAASFIIISHRFLTCRQKQTIRRLQGECTEKDLQLRVSTTSQALTEVGNSAQEEQFLKLVALVNNVHVLVSCLEH